MNENFEIYIRHGYGQIDNKDVLISYFHNKDFIEVLPLSKTEFLPYIPPHSSISLKYSEDIYKNCFAIIKNAATNGQHGYTGEIDYLCKLHDESERISVITIMSDEIDSVFNPLIYYYNARQSGEYDNPDLLYDSICIHQFNCNYKGNIITISVNYGHVFSRGIGSDLKTHAQLRIHMANSITVNETHKGQFLSYDSQYIGCENGAFVVSKEGSNDTIEIIAIKQDEDGIDTEDRIIKLKEYIKAHPNM